MPPVSEKQRRLMECAAHTEGGCGGVSQKVGKEFVGNDAVAQAAGVVFMLPDGRALFMKRAGDDHKGEYAFPGGGIEEGETAEQAARREVQEETGFVPSESMTMIDRRNQIGVDFTLFRQDVAEPFSPILNHEHTEFVWAPLSDAPRPLHPGVEAVLSKLAMDQKFLAFDRASVRTYDADGRLHVEVTNISKACVNPYLGKEIPDGERLGLDMGKVYHLLRDPAELEKAASTFNNLPLLSKHVPVSAEDHQPDLVIGATGSSAEYTHPFLKNTLVIWAKEGIGAVESETKKELSSAYRYRADMTPGEYEGVKYDGVMRDIVGNHVALVKEGRAGPDVVVGDSKNQEIEMSKIILSPKGGVAMGYLLAMIGPKLAADAKIDLTGALAGVTAKNFKEKKSSIVEGVKKAVAGKLAQDATIDEVVKLVDALEGVPVAEAKDDSDMTPEIPAAAPSDIEMDADPMEEAKKKLLAAGVDAKLVADCFPQKAMDAEADEEREKPGIHAAADAETEEARKKAEEEKKANDKKAMDSAIRSATSKIRDQVLTEQRQVREAERFVRPYVGDLAMDGLNTAEEVYGAALKAKGIKTEGVHPSAFRTILEMQPKVGEKHQEAKTIAMDASTMESFNKRFPGAAKVTVHH